LNDTLIFDGFAIIQLFSTGIALFLAVISFRISAQGRWPDVFLGLILIILAINIFHDWAIYSRYSLQLPQILGLGPIHYYLIGPLIYFYVRSLIDKPFEIKPLEWLHFLPALLFHLDRYPVYLQTASEKFAKLSHYYQTQNEVKVTDLSFGDLIIGFIPQLHWIAYLILALLIITKVQQQVKSDSTIKKLGLFFKFYILIQTLVVITHLFVIDKFVQWHMLELRGLVESAMVFLLAYIGLSFGHRVSDKKINKLIKMSDTDQLLWNQIEQCIIEQKMYRNSNLSVIELAKELHCSAKEISRLMNQSQGIGFKDFVNQQRISEACRRLDDRSYINQSRTLERLGYDVGFHSKSTFYRAFKKQLGINPTEYIQNEK